jgi:hypothetical protein
MINLGTQQLGNKLVRTFETKDGIRRAVTEVVDGKTLTHIFDLSGNHVVSRAKTFATEQVGNKTVRTIDKFETNLNIDCPDHLKDIRTTVNNIYKDKKYLGSRKTIDYNDGNVTVLKKSANSPITQVKAYYDSILRGRVEFDQNHNVLSRHEANNLGLPIPKLSMRDNYDGLSLRQMRDKFFNINPQEPYTYSKRLAKLNKVDASVILSPINDKIAKLTEKLNSMMNK